MYLFFKFFFANFAIFFWGGGQISLTSRITHKISLFTFTSSKLTLSSNMRKSHSVDNGCNRSVRRTNTKLIPSLTGILPIRRKTLSNQSIYRSREEPLKSQKTWILVPSIECGRLTSFLCPSHEILATL